MYFHRSWAGPCIFAARIERFADGALLTDIWVNCDQSQHIADTAAFFQSLVEVQLFGPGDAALG